MLSVESGLGRKRRSVEFALASPLCTSSSWNCLVRAVIGAALALRVSHVRARSAVGCLNCLCAFSVWDGQTPQTISSSTAKCFFSMFTFIIYEDLSAGCSEVI